MPLFFNDRIVGGGGQALMSATGRLLIPDGAVGTPGLAFSADPDTGIYRPGANALSVAAGGADVLEVTTSGLEVTGSLGIGTFSSSNKLAIGGSQTNGNIFNFTTAYTVSSNDQKLLQFSPTVIPSGAIGGTCNVLDLLVLMDGTNGVTTNTLTFFSLMRARLQPNANYDSNIAVLRNFASDPPLVAGSSTIGTFVGYYSGIDSSISGVTTPWAIMCEGSAPSLFNGDIRLGSGIKLKYNSGSAGQVPESDSTGLLTLTSRPFTVGATVLSPASGQNIMVWRAPFACTVTNVRSHFKDGTSVVYNARRNQSSTHLSSNQTNSTANAWADGGSVQNTAYAAGDDLEIQIVTVNGAVTEASIQVDYTRP
jgi:hypothetical protein